MTRRKTPALPVGLYLPPPEPGETDWFPGELKPVQPGVYRRWCAARRCAVFAHWDGWWSVSATTPEDAAQFSVLASRRQCAPWCGLVAPPAQGYGPATPPR